MPRSYWYERVRDGGPTLDLRHNEESSAVGDDDDDESEGLSYLDDAAAGEIARALNEPDNCTTQLHIETEPVER